MDKGTNKQTLDMMARRFGFTYSLSVESPFDWVRTENGSSKGLVYKVSTRQSDLGMSQVSRLPYRWPLVDHLPYMYVYETIFTYALPREIPSYGTLWYPFGPYMWSFIVAFTIAETVILLAMEQMWHNATRLNTSNNYIFECKFHTIYGLH